MPTVVFISPKGGAGKTTAALILACELARSADVTILDADPNRPIAAWASGGNVPARLRVVSNVDEDNIIDAIEEASTHTAFVIVDLEGTAAKIVLMAASQADLVIIPTQGSQLDAEQAGRAIKAVRDTQKMTGRATPYVVLPTRTSPLIRTRTMTHIAAAFASAGIQALKNELHEREAFRAVFSFRLPLDMLNEQHVANYEKAVANAGAFAGEVVAKLREGRSTDAKAA
jgi:chromosome partitioning protein